MNTAKHILVKKMKTHLYVKEIVSLIIFVETD